jgi:hypothetical protein
MSRLHQIPPPRLNTVKNKMLIGLTMAALCLSANPTRAGSLGDFFKALGNSIAHPGQKPKPKTPPPPNKRPKTKGSEQNAADYPPSPAATPPPQTPTPTATLSQPQVRPASAPSQDRKSKRDIPYAIPVPNKPGFVTSPYSPKSGYVDVRGFPSGTEVKDPYSGKIFLTP